ncbi:DUF6221 family protein [Nocardiopsis ansamitocini]|uniref:Uncharacterized protein n=1 Tax=Nocardiopsis ansamitocini TaxID=1670832 RepID=A0A9W6P501_9ACTN|nr:DUF6221 family protein [Nocardiopsis ansamitocini]GLU47184.1 hypothetical protein Nans01_15350 [Nocardiopsis ansamitocini]
MTIIEFLKARLDEDEKQLYASVEMGGAAAVDARRLLTEITAKRRIVERVEHRTQLRHAATAEGLADAAPRTDGHNAVLNHLALAYADHPDYSSLWRP